MEHLDRALEVLFDNGYTPLEIHFPRSDLWEMLRKYKTDTIRQYRGVQVFFLGENLRVFLGNNIWADVTPDTAFVYLRTRRFSKPVEKEEIVTLSLDKS